MTAHIRSTPSQQDVRISCPRFAHIFRKVGARMRRSGETSPSTEHTARIRYKPVAG